MSPAWCCDGEPGDEELQSERSERHLQVLVLGYNRGGYRKCHVSVAIEADLSIRAEWAAVWVSPSPFNMQCPAARLELAPARVMAHHQEVRRNGDKCSSTNGCFGAWRCRFAVVWERIVKSVGGDGLIGIGSWVKSVRLGQPLQRTRGTRKKGRQQRKILGKLQ